MTLVAALCFDTMLCGTTVVTATDLWMAGQTNRIEVTLGSVLDSVDLAEELSTRIAGSAGFDEEIRDRIAMAVREGVINALTYGSQGSPHKKIFLTLELNADKLLIRVLDQGPGFDLADVPDPLAEENLLKSSGRGIFLMRAFMDEFDVRRGAAGGAEVIMAKRLPSAAGGPLLAGSAS